MARSFNIRGRIKFGGKSSQSAVLEIRKQAADAFVAHSGAETLDELQVRSAPSDEDNAALELRMVALREGKSTRAHIPGAVLVRGICSSTSVDSWGTRMSQRCLVGMAEQMSSDPGVKEIPDHWQDDWRDVLGRSVRAWVEPANVKEPRNEGEQQYVLWVEFSVFDEGDGAVLLRNIDRGDPIGQSQGSWFLDVSTTYADDGSVEDIIVEEVYMDHMAVTNSPANPDSTHMQRSEVVVREDAKGDLATRDLTDGAFVNDPNDPEKLGTVVDPFTDDPADAVEPDEDVEDDTGAEPGDSSVGPVDDDDNQPDAEANLENADSGSDAEDVTADDSESEDTEPAADVTDGAGSALTDGGVAQSDDDSEDVPTESGAQAGESETETETETAPAADSASVESESEDEDESNGRSEDISLDDLMARCRGDLKSQSDKEDIERRKAALLESIR